MRFGSVCSGIEAASVAWEPLGWKAAWFSEIAAFPKAVLAHRYPDVPNLGDMTRLRRKRRYRESEIDILVGGTPCPSFSIAGLRKGLRDESGALALKFCEIAREKQPRWVVWENVPGVFTTNKGRDFGTILGRLVECGYSLAYRVLDAQSFGVPQSRKRVFVVGHLGADCAAEEVLFEREGGFRDAAASPELDDPSGAGEADGCPAVYLHIEGSNGERSHCLCASGTRYNPTAETFVIYNLPERGPFDPALVDVRRLTPREWERLQGFPDDYTLIPYGGKPACDAPRYEALGNSVAIPVLRWIGERIAAIEGLSRIEVRARHTAEPSKER